MTQDGHGHVATRALVAFPTAQQIDQQLVLVDVVVAFPARRVHARTSPECVDLEPRVLGQREQARERTVRVGLQSCILGKRGACLVDVEVDADIREADQVVPNVADQQSPFAQLALARGSDQ